MSEMQENRPMTAEEADKRRLQDIEAVRDLFARAHDLIAQAQYPGHMGMKVAEVLNFLAFQHNDFKQRAETLKRSLESKVDLPAVKAATEAVLAPQTQSPATPNE